MVALNDVNDVNSLCLRSALPASRYKSVKFIDPLSNSLGTTANESNETALKVDEEEPDDSTCAFMPPTLSQLSARLRALRTNMANFIRAKFIFTIPPNVDDNNDVTPISPFPRLGSESRTLTIQLQDSPRTIAASVAEIINSFGPM